MAGAPKRVRIEDIDLVLREAQICNAQLNILHHVLNRVDEANEEKRKAIESKTATIFRDLMSNLYSVLDQIYFFLYCHFQNNGNLSFSNAAFEIKQPIKQDLKWSDGTRDGLSECEGRRNEWVTKQCNKIFGGNYPEHNVQRIRAFQNNLLQLQAIRKVDKSGKEVCGANGEPTLLCARYIQNDAADLSQFNPSSIRFEELKSVKDLDSWNDTTIFNLLHFFRNFTAHRSLIACLTRKGWLNLETREFKCEDQDLPKPWVFIAKGAWILVPELSHLRQAGWVDPKCYQLPLLGVCAKALSFVTEQRNNLCSGVVDGVEHYPYQVPWGLDGMISFKKNEQDLGACYWDRANIGQLGLANIDTRI